MELIQKRVTVSGPHHKKSKKGHIAQKRTEQTLKRYRREQEALSAAQGEKDNQGPSCSKELE